MAEIRQTLTLSMLAVSAFGVALLGGLGSCSAGKAALAAKIRDSPTATQDQKDEARAMEAGAIASSVFFFGGLVLFAVLLMLAVYKR